MKKFDWFLLVLLIGVIAIVGYVIASIILSLVTLLGAWDVRTIITGVALVYIYLSALHELWLIGTGKKKI